MVGVTVILVFCLFGWLVWSMINNKSNFFDENILIFLKTSHGWSICNPGTGEMKRGPEVEGGSMYIPDCAN